ncbi:HAD family hydrolase [Devosia crocina]|uniref:HAD family hydrolase n=1 Tax=Devosia crocina TaxID=429728 RepID=UPI000B138CC9|nr:HAD-IA family hydrolase [Devosia crocina]
MTRALVFDVDGVLVHGYHARPELQRRWDQNLLADLGVDPDRFRDEFIFDIFVKKVVIGQTALISALDRRLPSLGFKGSSMEFANYWLSHDSQLNEPLLENLRRLKADADIRLFIATNQDHMRAQWLWQTLGLGTIFEDIFYSARAGVKKPNKAFFDFAASRMPGVEGMPLFFDDTPRVIEGARAYGWESVLFVDNDDFTNHPWIAERLK